MLQKWKPGWPQVAILAIVAAAFLGSYLLPADAQAELRTDLAVGWALVSTFVGPVIRRRLETIAAPEAPDA